jgi:hypothetical protein
MCEWQTSLQYLPTFRVAAISTALTGVMDVDDKYDVASVSITVTSQTADLPACQGTTKFKWFK